MGAWIETGIAMGTSGYLIVAPYMGAWIETNKKVRLYAGALGRSLYGSVD